MTGMLRGFLFTLLVVFGDVSANTLVTLTNQLLDGYDPTVRPYCPPDEKQVQVYLDVAVRQLISLDEPSQIIKLNLWILMVWNDCLMEWNPADYDNITFLTIPFDNIWKPDIILFDNISEELFGFSDYRAHVNSNGIVSYDFPTTVELQCPLDITNFPHDKQICRLTFGSWSYDTRDIDMFLLNNETDLSKLQQHVEWSIEKIPAKRNLITYAGYDFSFVDIVYSMHLKRKPEYYEANIISPSVIITLVGGFGFILPVDSGEKISLEVTVLLSQTVFQLLVADKLPPSADDYPWLGIYFTFTLYLSGFNTLSQVIVVYLYYREERKMSNRIQNYILIPLLYITFIVKPTENSNDVVEMDNKEKWKLLSVAVDRLSLALFVISVATGFGYIMYKFRNN